MQAGKALGAAGLMAVALAMGGCTAIRENRGYIQDAALVGSVQPGVDNRQSVTAALGRPSFTSQYGDQTWYYVSSVTGRAPFGTSKIRTHSVLAIKFDAAGNVIAADTSGIDQVAFLDPDGDKTPTLGRERGFLEDLFGNIGQVGVPGGAGPGG